MISRPQIYRLAFALCICASAHSFSVTPMLAQIDLSKTKSANLKVHNDSDKPVKIETKMLQKVQKNDASYESVDTKELIVFPPILKIAPNTSRTVRIIVPPQNAKKAANSYYKVLMHELPDGLSTAKPAADPTSVNVQIQVTTAFHIPVYIYPKNPNFSLELEKAIVGEGQITTWIKNTGNTIARLQEQNPFVRINDQWIAASTEPSDKLNALVVGNTIKQTWNCEACLNQMVTGVKISGKTTKFANFEATKTW